MSSMLCSFFALLVFLNNPTAYFPTFMYYGLIEFYGCFCPISSNNIANIFYNGRHLIVNKLVAGITFHLYLIFPLRREEIEGIFSMFLENMSMLFILSFSHYLTLLIYCAISAGLHFITKSSPSFEALKLMESRSSLKYLDSTSYVLISPP